MQLNPHIDSSLLCSSKQGLKVELSSAGDLYIHYRVLQACDVNLTSRQMLALDTEASLVCILFLI